MVVSGSSESSRLLQGVPRSATHADLRQVVIDRQLSQMRFDGVAVSTRGFLDFLNSDFPARFGQFQYLARKRWQGQTQSLLLFDLRGKVVLLLDHGPEEKHQPVFPVLLS